MIYTLKNIIERIIIDYLNVTERIKQVFMLKKNWLFLFSFLKKVADDF